ncbi:MAG: hypothetical protein GY820_39890 [Gammaproteobacteria bacterium]|nr:hypothetical protein [Gammaproteobacteria bacterium]
MSSFPRYMLRGCHPSWQRHLWRVLKCNSGGQAVKMQCVNCDQIITGHAQCALRMHKDGIVDENKRLTFPGQF